MLPASWRHHIPHTWHLGTQLKRLHIFWHTEKQLLYLLELRFKPRIICYTYDFYPFCWKHLLKKILDTNDKDVDVIGLDLWSPYPIFFSLESEKSPSISNSDWLKQNSSLSPLDLYIAWMIAIQYNSSSFATSKLQDRHGPVVRSTGSGVKSAWPYPWVKLWAFEALVFTVIE